MDLIKVDIKTGKALVNNLPQHWDKLGMNPGLKSPVYYTKDMQEG